MLPKASFDSPKQPQLHEKFTKLLEVVTSSLTLVSCVLSTLPWVRNLFSPQKLSLIFSCKHARQLRNAWRAASSYAATAKTPTNDTLRITNSRNWKSHQRNDSTSLHQGPQSSAWFTLAAIWNTSAPLAVSFWEKRVQLSKDSPSTPHKISKNIPID